MRHLLHLQVTGLSAADSDASGSATLVAAVAAALVVCVVLIAVGALCGKSADAPTSAAATAVAAPQREQAAGNNPNKWDAQSKEPTRASPGTDGVENTTSTSLGDTVKQSTADAMTNDQFTGVASSP